MPEARRNTHSRELCPRCSKRTKTGSPATLRSFIEASTRAILLRPRPTSLDTSYFRLDNGSPIKRSRVTEWLTDCARWCAGGWQSGAVTLGEILKGWRGLRRSLTRERDLLAARAKTDLLPLCDRDGCNAPPEHGLLAIGEACVNEIFAEEPGLGDEAGEFRGAA